MPLTPEELLARLDAAGIATSTVHHPPVFTVEEAKRHRGELAGGHVKNLFLRNKKGAMWLVVAAEDRPIDLKQLGARLGIGNLSFASPERLATYLGVIPGAVTPFAVVNDTGLAVGVILDRELLAHERVHCHPLTNAMTTAIAPADLIAFLGSTGHAPRIEDLG